MVQAKGFIPNTDQFWVEINKQRHFCWHEGTRLDPLGKARACDLG